MAEDTLPSSPPFQASGFFALRTPLLPLATFTAWVPDLEAPGAGPDGLAAALSRDRARLRRRLAELLARPDVREALFLASPSLDESLSHWRRDPEGERGAKVEASLVKYLARMSGRATPFGLFSGCSIGTLGEATRLTLAAPTAHGRRTRLDGDYLSALARALLADPAIRDGTRWRPNSSLYRAAGRLRFAVARDGADGRAYHLVAAEPTPHLEAALEIARAGALLEEVVATVGEVTGASLEDARVFALGLVRGQLLLPELEPAVTGEGPLEDMLRQLEAVPAAAPAAARLGRVRADLAALDAAGVGVDPARYREVAGGLAELGAPVALPRLFQVDLVTAAPGATLARTLALELGRDLARLHPALGGLEPPELGRFREAFLRRYEAREVPLAEVLDEESGIGFERSEAPGAEGSPLLRGLAFPPRASGGPPFDARGAWLFRRLDELARRGGRELLLEPADLDALAKLREDEPAAPLPDAFAVLAVLAAPPAASADLADHRVLLASAAGPSGAGLLGRFCHADPALRARVEQHLRAEEALRPDAVFAEVVHLPEGRLGNVLQRPVLRGHEIPFLGRSGAPSDRQIALTDLLVSVVADRIVLRSRRLGREVLPRLTSAINVHHRSSQGVHRFLATLSLQGTGGLGWTWGALDAAPFLPRVRAGRVVLSLARWRLDETTLRALGRTQGDERFSALARLRERLGLPRLVALADGDNVLPVDLGNVLSVEALVQLLGQRTEATLVELFPGPDELCASGPEGAFVHELVVPFVRSTSVTAPRGPSPAGAGAAVARSSEDGARSAAPAPTRAGARSPEGGATRVGPASAEAAAPRVVPRVFLPGSEWLYVKLYAGSATADRLLRDLVRPLVQDALASGAATGWFFVRLADPDWHVRVRLRGDPGRLTGEVLPALHRLAGPFVASGQLARVQLDTYEREVERYGGPGAIALVERLFQADSECVLSIVELLAGDAGADARWRLALRGTDLLLEDLGFDLARKRALVEGVRAALGAELRAGDSLWRQLGQRFRAERASLESLLDPAAEAGHPLETGLALLGARSLAARPSVSELRALAAAGRLEVSLDELAASLVHMHANRLLRSEHRAQELALAYLLGRLYEGQAARARRSTAPPAS